MLRVILTVKYIDPVRIQDKSVVHPVILHFSVNQLFFLLSRPLRIRKPGETARLIGEHGIFIQRLRDHIGRYA